jgi:hypothetical protein
MSQYKQLIIIADKLPNSIHNKKINFIDELFFHMEGIDLLYTSLVPGPELEAAKIARMQCIPYVVTIPFEGYTKYWPQKYKNMHSYALKKAIKLIHIDRQLGYISTMSLPGDHAYEKIENQIKWNIDRINLFKAPTKIIFYGKTFFTLKRSKIIYSLSSVDSNKWTLVEKVFSFPHSLPLVDDLPF